MENARGAPFAPVTPGSSTGGGRWCILALVLAAGCVFGESNLVAVRGAADAAMAPSDGKTLAPGDGPFGADDVVLDVPNLGGNPGAGGAPGSGGSIGLGGVTGFGGVAGFDGATTADTGGGGQGRLADAADAPVYTLVKLTGSAFGISPGWDSDLNAGFDKAFDGDIETYVDISPYAPGHTGIDLGTPAKVTLIRFHPRIGYPERMIGGRFQCGTISQTGTYSDLYVVPFEPPQAWTEVKLAAASTCRYLRYLSSSDGNVGARTNVAEVEFWGPPTSGVGTGPTDAGAPLVNLAKDKLVSASSQQNGRDASKGNDGSLSPGFCPESGAFPQWWRVDLGAEYTLVQSDINFEERAIFYRYSIDTSVDSKVWQTVIDQTKNTARSGRSIVDVFGASGVRARFVRVTITGVSDTTKWGCFDEFSVWGYGTPLASGP